MNDNSKAVGHMNGIVSGLGFLWDSSTQKEFIPKQKSAFFCNILFQELQII
jgi:hypothetical protein